MPRAQRLRSLLLLLALVAGQWLAFSHGFEHSALTPEVDCELGLQVRQLGMGAAPAAFGGLVLEPGAEAPVAPLSVGLSRIAPRAYRSRAPPHPVV